MCRQGHAPDVTSGARDRSGRNRKTSQDSESEGAEGPGQHRLCARIEDRMREATLLKVLERSERRILVHHSGKPS